MNIQFAGKNNLALIVQNVSTKKPAPVVLPVEHIAIIDVSGSMSSDLPELRRHLKNKLPTLVGVDDTITLIWFSGTNQFGVLQEGVPIRSLSDMSALNAAIDRFLQPVCLTGFVQPLGEVINVVGRLKAKRADSLINVLFMTDGYENQNTQKAVLDISEKISAYVDASAIIEFGWNCNRPLLTKMAEAMGANLIFSENLSDYQTTFEGELTKTIGGGKKVAIALTNQAKLGYAFTIDAAGKLVTYSVTPNNTVIVPESVESVAFFSTGTGGVAPSEASFQLVYAGLATLSQRMLASDIFDVLASLGDVALVNKFVNAFSKQDYSDFQTMCMQAAVDPAARYALGKDMNAVPKEDAYTVIDLLNDLSEDEGNLLFPLDPAFGYKRIGAGEKRNDDSLKFTPNEENPGIKMNCIVYNSERPNASLQTRMNGTVALPDERKKFPKLPNNVPSFVYRNYTIIRDGIVHTRILPVSLSAITIAKLQAVGVIDSAIAGEKFNLNIAKLPVINRQMVKNVSAKETFAKVFELECLKAAQKVFKHFRDEVTEKRSEGFSILFGEDAADWLKEIGITDYNGFSPKSTKEAASDMYMSKQLSISVAKLSSLPKVEDVIAKMASGKALTLRESIMTASINAVNAIAPTKTAEEKQEWLKMEADAAIAKVRKLNLELSKTKFAIIVGHVWFNDLAADQNSMELNINGFDITVTADLEEKEISV
jgi:hypothetical protein